MRLSFGLFPDSPAPRKNSRISILWLGLTLILTGLATSLVSADVQAAPRHRAGKAHHKNVAHKMPAGAFDQRYAAIVIDAHQGRVLHAQDADGLRFPASLTKMMTLYLTFEAITSGRLSFETRIPVSAFAAQQAPTKLGLKPGQTLSVREAVLGLITRSANDAAVALAEAIGGSEGRFADAMTRKARHLGMNQTVYHNASGLPDPEQHTTARDQARLAQKLQQDFPQHYPLFATEEFRFHNAVIPNHNHLLRSYEGADGLKTGFINASGFNLVASASRGDTRVIVAVFGGPTSAMRDRRVAQLLDYGFASLNGEAPQLVAVNQIERANIMLASAKSGEEDQGDADDEDAPAKAKAPVKIASIAKPAPKAPAPVLTAVAPGPWGIQVGAFRTPNSAKAQIELARQALPVLAPLKAAVVADNARKAKYHRARLIGLSAKDAQAACQALEARQIPCLPLDPEDVRAG